jgi:hypothetical protein
MEVRITRPTVKLAGRKEPAVQIPLLRAISSAPAQAISPFAIIPVNAIPTGSDR